MSHFWKFHLEMAYVPSSEVLVMIVEDSSTLFESVRVEWIVVGKPTKDLRMFLMEICKGKFGGRNIIVTP